MFLLVVDKVLIRAVMCFSINQIVPVLDKQRDRGYLRITLSVRTKVCACLLDITVLTGVMRGIATHSFAITGSLEEETYIKST